MTSSGDDDYRTCGSGSLGTVTKRMNSSPRDLTDSRGLQHIVPSEVEC
jgi:hypothetical protein